MYEVDIYIVLCVAKIMCELISKKYPGVSMKTG